MRGTAAYDWITTGNRSTSVILCRWGITSAHIREIWTTVTVIFFTIAWQTWQLPVGGGATAWAAKGFTAGAPGPPCGYPDPWGVKGPGAIWGAAGPWLWGPPGYMGTGFPAMELSGMGPDGKEVDGMKHVGGTPGLGIGGRFPGVDDEGCSWGPDKLAAGIDGPGGGKVDGRPMGTGWGWNGCWGRKPSKGTEISSITWNQSSQKYLEVQNK